MEVWKGIGKGLNQGSTERGIENTSLGQMLTPSGYLYYCLNNMLKNNKFLLLFILFFSNEKYN